MELLAELREDMRRVKRALDRIVDSSGAVRSTSVSATPIHSHSGGNQGGPLSGARHSSYDDFVEQNPAPGTPGAATVRMYAKTDGRMYVKDDTNTEVGPLVPPTLMVPMVIFLPYATWTNQPAALTEIFGGTVGRVKATLTHYNYVRLSVNVVGAGVAGATLRGQYSTDDSTYAYFDGSSEPSCSLTSTGRITSSWVALPAAAKADVWLRLVGINGDGAADPLFGTTVLEFKA